MTTFTSTLNEMKVQYFPSKHIIDEKPVNSPHEAAQLVKQLFSPDTIGFKEEVYAVFLNNSNKPLGYKKISSGGISNSIVDIRIILSVALKTVASGIILAHNHPSGKLKPSDMDIKLTKRLKGACELLQIAFLDHIIVSPFDNYYSFVGEGAI